MRPRAFQKRSQSTGLAQKAGGCLERRSYSDRSLDCGLTSEFSRSSSGLQRLADPASPSVLQHAIQQTGPDRARLSLSPLWPGSSMQIVNIHEAKTHLSRLLEAVERGEQVVIARAGQPVATLTAYRPTRRQVAPPGSLKGRDWLMADDFDAPVDELFSCLQEPEGATGIPGAGR